MARPGRELLRAAKAAASSEPPALCLPVGRPMVGLLRPVVTRPGEAFPPDVRALTEWRNRFVHAFLNEFVASDQRTERWLVESVGPDDSRILFMVEDGHDRTIGHMGLAFIDWETGCAEADAVVRGDEAPAGLLTESLDTMWRWARGALGLSRFGARVRSDNSAIVFFEKAGFRERRRVALRPERLEDGLRWVEDASLVAGDPSLVYMERPEDGD